MHHMCGTDLGSKNEHLDQETCYQGRCMAARESMWCCQSEAGWGVGGERRRKTDRKRKGGADTGLRSRSVS